ncbi:hypothetical protein E2320_002561 [Naja naja]|nr:hypothetical protein E2320_002561 [Naja naja]
MSAPQQGGEFSRVPPMNAKPQRMAPVGFNPGPGMGMVRRGMNTRNKALALGLGVAVSGICILWKQNALLLATSQPISWMLIAKTFELEFADAYTIYAFSQDVLLNEVETEAEIMRAQAAKTSSD